MSDESKVSENCEEKTQRTPMVALGLVFGPGIGLVFGPMFGDMGIALGLTFGAAIGLVVGACYDAMAKERDG